MALFRVRSASSTLFNKLVYSTSRSFCAAAKESETVAVNYIYAAQNMRPGTMIYNIENKPNQGGRFDAAQTTTGQSTREKIMSQLLTQDINSQIGSCMPLSMMRIGTMIHNIEMKPNQGGKLVRSAGTSAKILKEPTSDYVLVRLPSGNEKLIDTRCRATIGTVSNPSHKAKKLRKAGQARWLGRRPVVRGVAMNPVDHPHGGGEGRSKSSGCKGRTSLTPWGKPCKGGYKTGPLKRRK